nr:mucin-19-like [Setaria viridis]
MHPYENFIDLRRPSRSRPATGVEKALRVLSTPAGRTAAPPAASGGVPGEVVGSTAEVAPAAATGGVVLPPGTGEGADPAPPSTSLADPTVQSIAPRGPQAGEVIDLDADEAEGTTAGETGTDVPAAATGMAVATEEEEPAPAATAGTAAAGEIGTPATAAATEEAVATETGTSARGASAEVAPATEAEVPAPEAPTGAGTPVPAVATESDAATGMLAPAPASQAVAPPGRPAAASTGAGGCAPGPSVSPAASTTVESVLTALSSSASASASATPVPRAWRGSVLRWSSRDDPQRPLFTLDDATEWGKWQAMQGGLANARAALSSVLGQLDGIVLPGSQALQECSRGKSDLQRTGELSMQVAAAQQVIDDLQRREQAAQEDARRVEAKLQVIAERARCDHEDGFFWVILARELTQLREVLDAERAEHGNLRDAVRVVCDGLSVVQEEGTSSLATRVLGTYRRAREIALEALHTGMRRAFRVFGSNYSGINFAGMSVGQEEFDKSAAGRATIAQMKAMKESKTSNQGESVLKWQMVS